MVFGSPNQRSRLPGVVPDQAREWAAGVFRQALPAIADLGVTICMEPLSPAETDFVSAITSQLVKRIQPCDCVLPIIAGDGVPWMP